MSAASLPPFPTPDEALPRKQFTRSEVERYIEAGFFDGQRFIAIGKPLLVGSMVCSAPIALLSYFITKSIVARHQRRKAHQQPPPAAMPS